MSTPHDIVINAIRQRITTDPSVAMNDLEFLNIASHVTRNFYTLEDHPKFAFGEYVEVDLSKMLYSTGGYENARIVGLHSQNILDVWLCEFNHDFAPSYPYRVVSIQHTFIVKYNFPDKIVRLDDAEVFVKNENNRYELLSMQSYKNEGKLIHAYDLHTLMVVHKGRFTDQVIFELLREHRPQELQKLILRAGGDYTV
jgi:hypothetical protein